MSDLTFASLASSSKGNAYVVSDGDTTLLLECGLTFKELQKRLGYQVSGLTACLVSHEHQDHAKAAAQLLKHGVPVYMSMVQRRRTRMRWMQLASCGRGRRCGSAR